MKLLLLCARMVFRFLSCFAPMKQIVDDLAPSVGEVSGHLTGALNIYIKLARLNFLLSLKD